MINTITFVKHAGSDESYKTAKIIPLVISNVGSLRPSCIDASIWSALRVVRNN